MLGNLHTRSACWSWHEYVCRAVGLCTSILMMCLHAPPCTTPCAAWRSCPLDRRAHACRQAVVVAKRCMQLMPHHAETHLYYAILLFLSEQHARCLQHLDLVQAAFGRSGSSSALSPPATPPPHTDSEPSSAARSAGTRHLAADDVVLQRRPARSGDRCTQIHPVSHAATGNAAVVELVPASASAPAESLELMPRPNWGEVARRRQPADAGTGGVDRGGRNGASGGPGERGAGGGRAAGPVLTLDAPLPLDKSIFTPQVIDDVEMLRHKVALMLQRW